MRSQKVNQQNSNRPDMFAPYLHIIPFYHSCLIFKLSSSWQFHLTLRVSSIISVYCFIYIFHPIQINTTILICSILIDRRTRASKWTEAVFILQPDLSSAVRYWTVFLRYLLGFFVWKCPHNYPPFSFLASSGHTVVHVTGCQGGLICQKET